MPVGIQSASLAVRICVRRPGKDLRQYPAGFPERRHFVDEPTPLPSDKPELDFLRLAKVVERGAHFCAVAAPLGLGYDQLLDLPILSIHERIELKPADIAFRRSLLVGGHQLLQARAINTLGKLGN